MPSWFILLFFHTQSACWGCVSPHSPAPSSNCECIMLVQPKKVSDVLIFILFFLVKILNYNLYTFTCADLLFEQGFIVSLHI